MSKYYINLDKFSVDFNESSAEWFVTFCDGRAKNGFATAAMAIEYGYSHQGCKVVI